MSAFYDKSLISSINQKRIVIDNNVLALCSIDTDLMMDFQKIFQNSYLMLDPIVKLEFLKGSQTDSLFLKKKKFLEYIDFYEMPDHFEIYNQVKENALNVARIYSHHKHPEIKLGDILIIGRLMIYPEYFILTEDKKDFTTMLFDRIGVFSFQQKMLNFPSETLLLKHTCLMKFNKDKYLLCLNKLKN